jgi:hypothetical protein
MDLITIIGDAGVGFMSLFGGLFNRIAPPEGVAKIWTGVGALMAAIGFVVVKLLAHLTANSTSAQFWTIVAFVSIPLSVILFFVYLKAWQTWTFDYRRNLRIAGTEYTQPARDYIAANPDDTWAQTLFAFGGNSEAVWTPQSLKKIRFILGAAYSLFLACLAFTLYLAVEVIDNNWNNPSVHQTLPFKQRVSTLKEPLRNKQE